MKLPTTRCDEVVVQVIVRSYDSYDRPIGEAMTQPAKVFRSQAPDFWRYVDDLVRASTKAAAPKPPKPVLVKGKRGTKA